MRVAHVSLADWRNYASAECELQPGVVVLEGPNGQGKTNFVEAIAYLSTLRSHRVAGDAALVRAGCASGTIRASVASGDRSVMLDVQVNTTGANQAQINRAAAKPREITRYCHTVLFAPEDLAIVKGDPGDRRRFLDEILIQLSPRLAGVLSDYERVLRQRTTLLKTSRGLDAAPTLEVWNDKLVTLGAELMWERATLTKNLRDPASQAYQSLIHADHGLHPDYRSSWGDVVEDQTRDELAEMFHVKLTEALPKERERGVTLVGPHRDDLDITLNQLPVKGYASHGESWSAILSLRLAQAELLRTDSAVGDPIVILDDVFAELDSSRRLALTEAVLGYEQVIVTAAVPEDVPSQLKAQHISVRAGEISQVSA